MNSGIDRLYILNNYEKIMFTHPKKNKLIVLFSLHILLLIILYISPLLFDNFWFNVFYLTLITAMICGWITFNGECWINSWEKKILDPNYHDGDNLDVNPSMDFIMKKTMNLFSKEKQVSFNSASGKHQRNARYMVPIIVPFISFVIFLNMRFPTVSIERRFFFMGMFALILLVNHLKWNEFKNKYR